MRVRVVCCRTDAKGVTTGRSLFAASYGVRRRRSRKGRHWHFSELLLCGWLVPKRYRRSHTVALPPRTKNFSADSSPQRY